MDVEVKSNPNLVEVKNLVKYYPVLGGVFKRVVAHVKAVDDVSFDIKQGETLGLVGESGCGKSTVGHTIIRLLEKTSGTVDFNGVDVFSLKGEELKQMRKNMQIVFQDPYAIVGSAAADRRFYCGRIKDPSYRYKPGTV